MSAHVRSEGRQRGRGRSDGTSGAQVKGEPLVGARESPQASERSPAEEGGAPSRGGRDDRSGVREVPDHDDRVICYNCGSPCWTTNDAWFECDICGERVWLDFDHPHAPSEYAVRSALPEFVRWSL